MSYLYDANDVFEFGGWLFKRSAICAVSPLLQNGLWSVETGAITEDSGVGFRDAEPTLRSEFIRLWLQQV